MFISRCQLRRERELAWVKAIFSVLDFGQDAGLGELAKELDDGGLADTGRLHDVGVRMVQHIVVIEVVDDEPYVADVVGGMLERLGYRPVVFTDPFYTSMTIKTSAPF